MNYNEFTRLSLKAALSAGEILQRHFSKKIRIDYKGRIDPVTEADRSSQDLIFKLVRKQFPGHALLGEEGPRTVQSQEYCWIIDPLDGTVNFIHGVPIFCVSIGVMHQGKMISGVVHAPLLKETFVAERGERAPGSTAEKFKSRRSIGWCAPWLLQASRIMFSRNLKGSCGTWSAS
jgi:myo-inositol-1(or 4)-monophosphatase